MISRLLRSLLEHGSRAEMRDENARIGVVQALRKTGISAPQTQRV